MTLRFSLAAAVTLCGLSMCRAEAPADNAFHPTSMAYVLQADKLAPTKPEAVQKLAASGRDIVVIDPFYKELVRWTPDDIAAIRSGKPGRRVLAYISIGEAEDYRDYWHNEWDANKDGHPDAAAPKFLCDANPDWPGNYKVRYWQAPWQKIVLSYLDAAVAQGFDGAYLDIVDGFEFFEQVGDAHVDNMPNKETNSTYRRDMADWVATIAAHARANKPGFLIVPQNGSQLLDIPEYVKTIDAIGNESLFTDGEAKQKDEDVQYVLHYLKKAQAAHKPVLLIEYGENDKLQKVSIDGAKKNGLKLLLTDRDLTKLGTPGQ